MKIAATFWAFRGEKSTPEWPEKKYKSDLPLSDSDRCRSQLIIFCGEFPIGVYKSKEWDCTCRPLRDRSAGACGTTFCGVGEAGEEGG